MTHLPPDSIVSCGSQSTEELGKKHKIHIAGITLETLYSSEVQGT